MFRTLLVGCATFAALGSAAAGTLPPLPEPVSNNAVASLQIDGIDYVTSFSGISSELEHADIHSRTYVLNSVEKAWYRAPNVPGDVGRLASVAVSAASRIYVFGGYTVDEDGNEVSTPWVHQFDPVAMEFTELPAMPVPVDDAVAVTYQDRYIYLISGWHDFGNVNLVQVFDTREKIWSQATPIPGNALFGHAGGIVGHQMMFCDGVTVQSNPEGPRDFVASNECFLGSIDNENFRRIDWHPIDAHPGLPRYRMAASGIASRNGVAFIGGSENPYNFNGVGYNGSPSEPAPETLWFDLGSMQWSLKSSTHSPSMDHRGLIEFEDAWLTLGGILDEQKVTDRVSIYFFSATTE